MLSLIQCRCFHTARTCYKKTSNEGRFMMKLMTGSSKPKKVWHMDSVNSTSSIPEIYGLPRKGNSKVSARRLAVLGSIFTEKITDLMSTGPLSGELSGKGFCITQIKVTPDASRINIYWTSSELPPVNQLTQLSAKLRHELIQLRVCGNIPQIGFIMDKFQVRANYVDQLLGTTTNYSTVDEEPRNLSENEENSPPTLSDDVLGLNRGVIIQKIIQAKNKSEGKTQHEPVSEGLYESSDYERMQKFTKYLAQQKKQHSKQRVKKHELFSIQQPVQREENEEDWIDGDYIDEDAR